MRNKICVAYIGEASDIDSEVMEKLNSEFDFTILSNDSQIGDDFKYYDCIISSFDDESDCKLYKSSIEIRGKWCNVKDLSVEALFNCIYSTLCGYSSLDRCEDKIFSIFTCLFNTPKSYFDRLYNSLLSQTYHNWNWYVLIDNCDWDIDSYIKELDDYHITAIRNVTNHGVIGFNKHMIAMCCNGDYLVEVDHDDELTDDCLEHLYASFYEHKDAVFAFSDTLELVDGNEIYYGNEGEFALGCGSYKTENVNGKDYNVAVCTPSINCKTIRLIYSQPNHVRCWDRNFYHFIGGHDINLSVCDDCDLMLRTFLEGKMIHINKVLYIQHENGDRGKSGTNTQSVRFDEIQRTTWLLYNKYDRMVHDRIISMGYEDQCWDDEKEVSVLDKKIDGIIDLGYQYYPQN